MWNSYLSSFKKSFDSSGRASSAETLYFLIINLLIIAIVTLIGVTIESLSADKSLNIAKYLFFVMIAASLPARFCLAIRRMHDLGYSGWRWFLFAYVLAGIPIVGFIVAIPLVYWLYIKEGIPYENEHGVPVVILSESKTVGAKILTWFVSGAIFLLIILVGISAAIDTHQKMSNTTKQLASTELYVQKSKAWSNLVNTSTSNVAKNVQLNDLSSEGLTNYFASGERPLGIKTSSKSIATKGDMIYEFTGNGNCKEGTNGCWAIADMKTGKKKGLLTDKKDSNSKIKIFIEFATGPYGTQYLNIINPQGLQPSYNIEPKTSVSELPSKNSSDNPLKTKNALDALSDKRNSKANNEPPISDLTSAGLASYFSSGSFSLGEKTSSNTVESKDGMIYEFTGNGSCKEGMRGCWVVINTDTKAYLELLFTPSWPNGYLVILNPEVSR